jgi:xanthine dehydrogenase YagR molybdenum-binding subunit
MAQSAALVGSAQSRVDGVLKVTGEARYAAEFFAADLAYGYVVSSAIAKGRVTGIDLDAASAVPGVIKIFTHENRPRTAWFDFKYRDEVAPPGHPFRPFYDETIHFSGQPIALVVAEAFEIARYAASLVQARYEAESPAIDLEARRDESYEPPKKRSGVSPPPKPRGDAIAALSAAPIRIDSEYHVAIEHHNPMELQATTVLWGEGGHITVHDKTQGVQNTQSYLASVFGQPADKIRVVSPFVGGAFGIGLRPQYQVFLAVMAALDLERSVRVTLTREQGFTVGYRPDTRQRVALGADADGRLQAIRHDAVAGTSTFEDHQEVVVNWSGLLYRCDNVKLTYELAKIDTASPTDMRAPGAALGVYALEVAMDELAYAAKLDPVELRLRNYAERDDNEDKTITSKELRKCYEEGAARFGWSRRTPAPRSMREGRELIGWGMATGVWEAQYQKTAARATMFPDGRLEIACATSDIGTGTYTVLAQIAADALGIPIERVTVKLADSSLPKSPVEGGSWTAASAGGAAHAACRALMEKLLAGAKKVEGSPLSDAKTDEVGIVERRLALKNDRNRGVSLVELMQANDMEKCEAEGSVSPSKIDGMRYIGYTHSAIFAEARVDEELGVVRVTRVVNAVAAGKIVNLKTARSQILGGVVMGIGMALHEETLGDRSLGRFMNHNLAEYHVPVNADIHDIDVIFVEERDDKVSPLGIKGVGEIGIVGTAAAVANAIFHATGKRVRDLPITLDKLL